jgi:hypothetical protein
MLALSPKFCVTSINQWTAIQKLPCLLAQQQPAVTMSTAAIVSAVEACCGFYKSSNTCCAHSSALLCVTTRRTLRTLAGLLMLGDARTAVYVVLDRTVHSLLPLLSLQFGEGASIHLLSATCRVAAELIKVEEGFNTKFVL